MPNYQNGLRGIGGPMLEGSWAELATSTSGGSVIANINGVSGGFPAWARGTVIGDALSIYKLTGVGAQINDGLIQTNYSGLYLIEYLTISGGGALFQNSLFAVPAGGVTPTTSSINIVYNATEEATPTTAVPTREKTRKGGYISYGRIASIAGNSNGVPLVACVPLDKGMYIFGFSEGSNTTGSGTPTGGYLRATALKIWE